MVRKTPNPLTRGTMPSVFRAILAESADLLVRSVKMTILVAALTLAIILVGWFFSSGLPLRTTKMINGT